MTTSALAKLSNSIKVKSLASTTNGPSESQTEKLKQSVIEQLSQPGGTVRDGRIDAVAGNGAISELGAGVEAPLLSVSAEEEKEGEQEQEEAQAAVSEKPEIVGPKSSSLVREAAKSLKEGTSVTSIGTDGVTVVKAEKEMERLPVVVINGSVTSFLSPRTFKRRGDF